MQQTSDAPRTDRLTLAAKMARRGEHEPLEAVIDDLEQATSTDDVLAALRLPDRTPLTDEQLAENRREYERLSALHRAGEIRGESR